MFFLFYGYTVGTRAR